MHSYNTPVLLIVYKRPELLAQILQVLDRIRPNQLFVMADGPQLEADVPFCKQTRQLIDEISWPCTVNKLYYEENVGLRKSISSAINWFFEHVDRGIILEDDCLPDDTFFEFQEEVLARYASDDQILSVNGSNLGYRLLNGESYCFSRFMNMWGWGTWRRSAALVDYEMQFWQKANRHWLLYTRANNGLLDFDWIWVRYWYRMLTATWMHRIETWAYQWVGTGLRYNMLSIVPSRNLVKNLGFRPGATHTSDPDNPIARLELEKMQFPLIHPTEKKVDLQYHENQVKRIWVEYERQPMSRQVGTLMLDMWHLAERGIGVRK